MEEEKNVKQPVITEEKTVSENTGIKKNEYGDTEIDLVQLLLVYIKKWWLLGLLSLVAAVAVFFVVSKVINKNSRTFEITYTFSFPEIDKKKVVKEKDEEVQNERDLYPDGTTYTIYDILNAEVINTAISSNVTKFGSFKAEEIPNVLFVSQEYEENAQKEKLNTGRLILKGSAAYFGDTETFQLFTKALLDAEAQKIKDMSQNLYYFTYLDSYDRADTFKNKLAYLKKQKEYIKSFYDSWIENYGQQYTADYPIIRYSEDMESAFSEDDYNKLTYELAKRQYTYNADVDEATTLKISIEILNDEHEDNQKKIEGLVAALEELRKTDSGATTTDPTTGKTNETTYYDTIAKLTQRQVDIERQIDEIQTQIDNINATTATKQYLAKLDEVRATLAEQTNILRKVANMVYTDKTEYIFDLGSFKVDGTKSAPLFAAVAFIAVYLIAGFIIFAIESYEDNKKKKA